MLSDMVNGDEKSQSYSELELLAKSGFLSICGMTVAELGLSKHEVSFPQQPTNNVMFYYVHSLMIVTKVLLALHQLKT